MNHILKRQIDEGHVIVYMDDILVFTNTMAEHRRIVQEVLDILRENKLYLKPEKCTFESPHVDYLGVIVGNGEIRMDPKKVEAVTQWPILCNLRELCGFVSFCNFYCCFIKNFSKIIQPLHDLTKKNVPFV